MVIPKIKGGVKWFELLVVRRRPRQGRKGLVMLVCLNIGRIDALVKPPVCVAKGAFPST